MTGLNSLLRWYLAREVLIPITLAILLLLRPRSVSRGAAAHTRSVLGAVLIGLGAIGGIGGIIGMQVAGLAADVPQYASTIEPGHLRARVCPWTGSANSPTDSTAR
jgi:hypothetical protein